MATTVDTRAVTVGLPAHWEQMEGALADMMAKVAQEAVRLMKNRVTKWRSTLTNSITAVPVSRFEWNVAPGVDYAEAVETGSRPGKGLPRWTDPAAADIKAWLESKVFKGRTRARRGRMGQVTENLELRDRYQGLSWHVRHHGVKANPYVRPTAELMRRVLPQRVEEVVREQVAKANAQGGAA